MRLRSKLPIVWRDNIPWSAEYHFSPPDTRAPHFLHHPVRIGSENRFTVWDRGRVVISLKNGCYEFHPLEWAPEPPLYHANPWCHIPFDARRQAFAEKVKQQFELETAVQRRL